MAEEQGPDGLSKRERQKARRQARRQEELAKAKRQQATSKAGRILAIAVVLGLLGLLVGRWWLGVQRDNDLKERARETLTELGCTEDEQQPNQPAGHIEDLNAVTPEAAYPDRPASSGPHIGTVVKSGVFDKVIDERLLVHNLEHGYVNIYYSEDAPAEQVEQMKEWARDRIDSGNPKMIVAPQHGEWTDPEKNFALVAWRYRQMCETWDPGVALLFMDAHYGLAGIAPEKNVPPHMGGQGVVDPETADGPVVFPPLTEDDPHHSPASASPSPGATASPDGAASPSPSPSPTAEADS